MDTENCKGAQTMGPVVLVHFYLKVLEINEAYLKAIIFLQTIS